MGYRGHKKFDYLTPVLSNLHWLPVKQRIIFKTLLLTYRILNGMAPQYLVDLLSIYKPSRPLRSADKCLLSVPRSTLKSYGDKCFTVAAPKEWNSLPIDIRNLTSLDSFKRQLKTFLFKQL